MKIRLLLAGGILAVLILALVGVCALIAVALATSPKDLAKHLATRALLQLALGPSFSSADYQLIIAVGHRDDVEAELALKNGADPNFRGLGNETQLMMASQNDSVKVAEVLLKHGANPDLKNEVGYSALMIASQFPKPEIDKVLLEHGANPNLKADSSDAESMGTEGYTALMIACRDPNFETARVLLDHGADPRCVGADRKTALDIVKQQRPSPDREATIKLLEQRLK